MGSLEVITEPILSMAIQTQCVRERLSTAVWNQRFLSPKKTPTYWSITHHILRVLHCNVYVYMRARTQVPVITDAFKHVWTSRARSTADNGILCESQVAASRPPEQRLLTRWMRNRFARNRAVEKKWNVRRTMRARLLDGNCPETDDVRLICVPVLLFRPSAAKPSAQLFSGFFN